MALSFIFDPGKGETPASVAKQRAIVEALMASQRVPRNVGEGLNALGDGIVTNVLNRRADAAESAGQSHATAGFDSLLNAGTFPPAPGGAPSTAATGAPGDYHSDQLAWTDAAPYQKAFLNTLAGPESGGRYDVMYGGGKFTDFSRHPNQAVRIQTGPNAGRTSSAAGKYQFLGSTWDQQAKELGLPDFSPVNQDKAAWNLASETYKAKTGQDLGTVLQSGDPQAIAGVGNALRGVWTSLPGGIEQGTSTDRFVATYQRALGAGASPAEATQIAQQQTQATPPSAPVPTSRPGVQVASMDPGIGILPPSSMQNTDTGISANAPISNSDPGILAKMGAPYDPSQPYDPAADARARNATSSMIGYAPGGPGATTPAGQRVLGAMMDKTPMTGAGGVVQALSAAQQPATAAPAPSPVTQALAGATQPQQATPASAGVQRVAQAMTPQDDTSLPVMAGGSADAIQPGQAGPSIQQIMQVAADPWASPEQKAMASMMLKQKMDQADPGNQLDMEYKRAQIEALNRKAAGGEAKFGNSVVWGQDANGNWIAMQPSSGGGLEAAKTPEGVKLSPPGIGQVNLGTSYAIRDRNGNIVNNVPIDNAGKASDTEAGKGQGEARVAYNSMVSKLPGLETVVKQLDDLSNRATYTTAGQIYDAGRKELGLEPRDAAIARTDYISTVANQILPLLRDTFGAQFTAREGDTLMATMGDPDKTPAEKQAVLRSFIEQKRRDIEALARQTGQEPPAAVVVPPSDGVVDYKDFFGGQ